MEYIEELKKDLKLLDIEGIMQLTGWAKPTVINLMAQKDFPTIKVGKKNLVTYDAFKNYFSVRRALRGE